MIIQSQLGSGFNQYVFLPSDPDELVDQLKLIVSEQVGGNDNPVLNEQQLIELLINYYKTNALPVIIEILFQFLLKSIRLWNKEFILRIRVFT